MKRILSVLAAACVLGTMTSGAQPVWAEDKTVKVTTAWLPGFEAFIPWYAKARGWDADEGLDLELLYFSTGEAQLEALEAGEWVLGATDGLTQVLAEVKPGAYMIGLANDESQAAAVFAKPDHPVFLDRGWNKDFPKVYGTPDSIKGREVLVTRRSPSHYALSLWLKVFGLKDSDMNIVPVDQATILDAFDARRGEFACIRTPLFYLAEEKGWDLAATIPACNGRLANTLIGDRKFCDKNPKTVSRFLRVYFRVVHMLKETGATPEIVDEYIRFQEDWAGADLTLDMAERDFKRHPLWDLDEQKKMFTGRKAAAVDMQKDLALLMADAGLLTLDELKKVRMARYVADKFLRQVGKIPKTGKKK